jgi:hypothetical protein
LGRPGRFPRQYPSMMDLRRSHLYAHSELAALDPQRDALRDRNKWGDFHAISVDLGCVLSLRQPSFRDRSLRRR